VILVWSVDRLGRLLQHLVDFLSQTYVKRIDLYFHQQRLTLQPPPRVERCFRWLTCSQGSSEASLGSAYEPVSPGKRRMGRLLGRPKVTAEVGAAIRRACNQGEGIQRIAREVGCGVSVVQRVIRESA
jgi:DNA invertase Pin-like site-specific DNA recombinase